MDYYRSSVEALYAELNTGCEGLSQTEAEKRLLSLGHNELEAKNRIHPVKIFLDQFKSFIIYILLFAVAFSLLIGEYVDSMIILIILLTNAFIGFFQELSANKSLEALKKLASVQATVLRDGKPVRINARYLVPGDFVLLEAGDKVPADCRLIHAVRLQVEESSLTGESAPAEKHANIISDEKQIGDQHNMVFSATSVTSGNAKAIVTATGMQTEIGRIARLIKEADEELTPLQQRLDAFGKNLGYVIIGICVVIFLISLGEQWYAGNVTPSSFIAFAFIAISLAVAAVPTALPAVVTIALAIGVKRLLAKKALVRRLSSVETLGSCDVICTDKTGTLTENQMTVRHAWNLDGEAHISGTGYEPEGIVSDALSGLLFEIGQVCNNSTMSEAQDGWQTTGDPTEIALLVSAMKAGAALPAVKRLDEIPFDSDRKMMSVLLEREGGMMMFSKGAPGNLLDACSRVEKGGEVTALTPELRDVILRQNDAYAAKALRVLAFAYRPLDTADDFGEEFLVFAGLQAMIDPPRQDVVESISRTKKAGIRVIMITGDYLETARAIGREIGIEGEVCSGEQINAFSDTQLVQCLAENTNIFARVVPEHKQRIVAALQRMGHTVAMTGDGVNDAPALKKANIGVAVGSGTDVAKEAADFVLLDDSFTHIVNAIEEGRGIYDNIQKSIMLLLSGNFGEVMIIFLAVVLGLNLPLTAILLLWINMVTDGAPALAYSVDPYGKDIMLRKPKNQAEGILPKPQLQLIGALGTVGTLVALTLFWVYGGESDNAQDVVRGQTVVFNFVVLYEAILVFVIRHGYKVPFFSNKWVWCSVLLCVVLQAMLMYTPLHEVFKIVPLGLTELGGLCAGGLFFYGVSLMYERMNPVERRTH